MSTMYCVGSRKAIKNLALTERLEIYKAVKSALKLRAEICVVLDCMYDEPYLYGVYIQSRDWVSSYYQSGGAWDYVSPMRFLR